MIVPRPRTWVAAVAAALVVVVPAPAAASVHITTTPGLTPGFELDVPDYVARCERGKPLDFPTFTVHRHRRPESQFYVLTPVGRHSDGYVAVFDARGVPVWWIHSSWYAPWDGKLMASGNLMWSRIFGTDFGLDPRGGWEEHRFDGTIVRVLQTKGTPTDFHDMEQEPNGDYLLDSYHRRSGTHDLRPFGGPKDAHVYDAVIQELDPAGNRIWSWSS